MLQGGNQQSLQPASSATADYVNNSTTGSTSNFQMGLEAEAMAFMISLKKGLHSSVVAQQIQSVVRFTDLITEYPLPIIANSTLLKLADVFRDCNNNFVRYWIVSVFEEVKGELLKVLNQEELIRRISAVLGSNDPIARSLALRMFGHMAEILSDRTDLHHLIEKNLLTCIEGYERESCVVAIEQICSSSKQFASQILPQIEILLNDIKSPPQAKLSLIRVLRHMHSDVDTVNRTFKLCSESLLRAHPTTPFILAIIDTLTQLAQNSVFIGQDTFKLLFNIFELDGRKKVKIACLNSITKLSKNLSDTYTLDFPFDMLSKFLNNSPFDSIKICILKLLASLSYSPFNVKQCFNFSDKNNIIHTVELLLFYQKLEISDFSFEIMINAVRHSNQNEQVLEPLLKNLSRAFCFSIPYRVRNNDNLFFIKKICEYLVRFIKSFPGYASLITKTLLSEIGNICTSISSNQISQQQEFLRSSNLYFSKCLLKISSHCPNVLVHHLTAIYETAATTNLPDEIIVNLYEVIFHVLYINRHKNFNNEFSQTNIKALVESKRYWCLYLLAKNSMFYNHFSLSESILNIIKDKVEEEATSFYLKSLSLWASAENLLFTNYLKMQEVVFIENDVLQDCLQMFDQATMLLKASGVSNSGFQQLYFGQRRLFIDSILNLTLHLANFNEPRNTATSNAVFQHQSQVFISLSDKLNDMINSFFDIDMESAKTLELQALACRVIAKAISTILVDHSISSKANTTFQTFSKSVEMYHSTLDPLFVQCQHILKSLESFDPNKPYNKSVLIHQLIMAILKAGAPVPQFFFNFTPNTAPKLEIEINNTHNIFSKPVTAILGQGLVIKFSGYITQQRKQATAHQRKVKSVCLTIEKKLISSSTASQTDGNLTTTTNDFEGVQKFTIPVVEQSFQMKCLCHFKSEGKYQLAIRTQMVDENDCYIWWTSNLAVSDVNSLTSYGSDEKRHISIVVDVKPFPPTANRLTL
ncbi:hypothetical protein C9374_000607 [Naegleria lovaniensis]|uniref:Integrator complex subunit 7 n=1 Tax=Naegleria lovaniensis TaxID=51637 RepID=A0AA88GY07_NAELO|nr:uncharacterized protein C9374_000607 [Naegleria lovaniensis]KAG2388443.1 hypothetical protein C9374_000607 [Naegleria lovaniensis]